MTGGRGEWRTREYGGAIAYEGLRRAALSAAAGNVLAPPGPEHPDVSGLLIDVPSAGGYASVVSLTDGTTSLYTSVGGGILGAGAHEHVAGATRNLLFVVQMMLWCFTDDDDGSLPGAGLVRFHLLSRTPLRLDVPEESFWVPSDDDLTPLISAAHGVITAIREA